MKRNCLLCCAVAVLCCLVVSCGDSAKNSVPVSNQAKRVVATTEQEIFDVVTALMGSNELSSFMSKELASMSSEASLLQVGNASGDVFVPFDWNVKTLPDASQPGRNVVDDIIISSDSVNVAMTHTGKNGTTHYVLVMIYEDGRWCVDDVLWPGKPAPADTERHVVSSYSSDAIDNLTGGDAAYIVEAQLLPVLPDVSTDEGRAYCNAHPEVLERSRLVVETARHYLKQNRSYTEAVDARVSAALSGLE